MSLQTLLSDLRSPGVTRTRIGAAILALVVLTAGVLAYLGLPLVGLAGQQPPAALKSVTQEQLAQRRARFAQRNTLGQERITTRWPFYNVPPKVVVKPTGPVPQRYGGPALIAMINGAAWFQDGKRLSPGDPAQDGLEVLEVVAPWHARVRWQGGEFTVTLFERAPIRLTGGLDELRHSNGSTVTGPGSHWTPTMPVAGSPASTVATNGPRPSGPGGAPAAGTAPGGSPVVARGGLPNSIELPGGGRFTIPAGGVPGQPQTIVMPDGRTATMLVSPVTTSAPGVTGQQVMIAMPATAVTTTPATPGQPVEAVQLDVVVQHDLQPAQPSTNDPPPPPPEDPEKKGG